ncbi:OmpA family protein [Candidatus Calescamantes bacterium]|nr:OmpA family protein [Candidatus Calescamantes bacterium]
MNKKYYLLVFLLTGMIAFSASFNYSSALVNAPSADVLENLGYYLSINHAQSFSSDIFDGREAGEQDLNFNFGFQVPMEGIFKLNFEVGLSVFSMFSDFSDQNLFAGNVKLQVLQDPTDKDYKNKYDFDKNPVYKFLPSFAIGVKNISGDAGISPIGLIGVYTDPDGNTYNYASEEYQTDKNFNNSIYVALSKKFYIGPMFIQGHLGWGTGVFQGMKKVDRNVGVLWGISTTLFPINKLSPLRIMLDYDGNQYSFGAQLIYNNPQLLSVAKSANARKFIPGFVVNLAITDIDEAIHTYETAGWSPKIVFGLGVTNNAYLIHGSDEGPAKKVVKKKSTKKKAPKKKVTKKKTKPKKKIVKKADKKEKTSKEPVDRKALARKRAMDAKRKAQEARKRAMAASTGGKTAQPEASVKVADLQKIFSDAIKRTVKFVEEDGAVKFIPRSVRFKKAAAVLLSIAFKSLDEIGAYLKSNPDVKIQIQGHTDNTGTRVGNIDLSGKRAQAVKDYLVKKFGISAGRLTVKGVGPDKPRYDNATKIGQAKNRRVEFIIVQ